MGSERLRREISKSLSVNAEHSSAV
jgi:hypothetical protein